VPKTIFEALRESHAIQRTLIRKLLKSDVGERRVTLFTTLRRELAAHEAAEERHFYTRILMDDRGLQSTRDALSDHHKMDKIVEDLEVRDHGRRGWMATVKKLSKELHDHLREEEKIFFQIAGKILSAREKAALAGKYAREYARMLEKLAIA
jgi:hemerythrin superfamily protein